MVPYSIEYWKVLFTDESTFRNLVGMRKFVHCRADEVYNFENIVEVR